MLKAQGHCASVEACLLSCECLYPSEISEELPTIDKLQDEVEITRVLCESLVCDDEWMIHLRVDVILVVDVVDLLGLDDFVLAEQLEGHVFAGLLVFGHLHLTETT